MMMRRTISSSMRAGAPLVSTKSAPPELAALMHGRKNRERRDSVTCDILEDRRAHQELLQSPAVSSRVPLELVASLSKAGLGSKKRKSQVYSNSVRVVSSQESSSLIVGAGGVAVHLTSASGDWPVFEHVLPEVAFAGHSNSGKSTLVNAISGLLPRKGPASVSDRAGWTDLICFYQLGKKPPLLILADMPGYGHAVASTNDKKAWKLMIRDYLQTRVVLAQCCVLVDCTRGLCDEDRRFISMLHKWNIGWQIVLTKADLLAADALAASMLVVRDDLERLGVLGAVSDPRTRLDTNSFRMIRPVSAATGAGITSLWRDLRSTVELSTQQQQQQQQSVAPQAVREHVNAGLLRQAKADRDRSRRAPVVGKGRVLVDR